MSNTSEFWQSPALRGILGTRRADKVQPGFRIETPMEV
jgi:hypothetical protein